MADKTRLEQIQEMLADEPNDPMLRYMLAMEYASRGDDEEAVRSFRALLAVAADYVPAYMQLGQVLVRLDRPDEARTVFQDGIEIAQQKREDHAAGEMQAMLAELD
jgi:Flp pilus assembly protein TadD